MRIARKGWYYMGYRFVSKDLGEAWDIEENDFLFHPEMWYQSVANHVSWYRERRSDMQQESMNLVYCYHDGRYCGAIAVSDGLVQWVIHEPTEKYCRVERVIE